jgi:3-oxoacyl-[acyl-carrier protein] reductase
MISILITGGAGDWATSFQLKYGKQFNIKLANRTDLDVTSKFSVTEFFKKNTFDVIINNAGAIHPKRILEVVTDDWINDINVNLIGTFLVTKYALEKNRDAMIISISSTAGFNSYPDWSSYCSSKAGVITFTKCLAKDNINAYCLCPGALDTKFRDHLNLSNDNVMDCDELSKHVLNVIKNKYDKGDILFFRKNEFILNP